MATERSAPTQNLLLAALDAPALALLTPHLKAVEMKQNQVLQEAGTIHDYVYFPVAGMISLLAVLSTGASIEIAAIGREGAFGTKIGKRPQVSFARAVVQLSGRALRIDLANFYKAAAANIAVAELSTSANDVLFANLQQSAACNALHPIEARLARWLLHASDRVESDDLPLTQEFLAEMLGVRRTSVTLAARILQRAGMISYRRGHLAITNREALESVSCECYQAVRQNIARILKTSGA
jgi:CRP-like cAMP-binding protein